MYGAGVANPEMTFADTSQDPVPKRRKQTKAGKAGKAGEEGQGAEAAVAAVGHAGTAAGAEEAASEPAELTRFGAAEVAIDADVSIVAPQGEQSVLSSSYIVPNKYPATGAVFKAVEQNLCFSRGSCRGPSPPISTPTPLKP